MENKGVNLAKNTIIIFISKFSTQFLSFFILPIVTAKLSTSEYGSFDLITTYSWLIAAFMSLQIENGIFRFLIDNRNNYKKSKEIISSSIFIIAIQSMIIIILFCVIKCFINFENDVYILAVSISVLIINIPLQITRGKGNNLTYSIASIITGITNITFIFILVNYYETGLFGIVFANIISNICGAVYIFIKEKIYNYCNILSIKKETINEVAKYSIPLLPNGLSSWIISISDKIMITCFFSVSANGIYSISTKFSILLSHIYNVFNLSWTESASINSKEDDKNIFFSKSINRIFFICATLCLFCLAGMPIIFKILINENYSEAYKYIPILILATYFEIFSGLLGAIYVSEKKSKRLAFTTFLGAIVNIIINFVFMKKFGLIIACCSTVISYITVSIYRYIDINKNLNMRIKINVKKILLLIGLNIVISYLYYKNSIVISLCLIMILFMFAYILNRDVIKIVFSSVKRIMIKKYNKV